MKRISILLPALLMLGLLPATATAGSDARARLIQAATLSGATKTLTQSLTALQNSSSSEDSSESEDKGKGKGDGLDDDGDGGKLGGVWTGSVSFFGDPSLDFDFTWNVTRLVEHFYLLEATRVGDSTEQNGFAVQLTHGNPDVALHGGFGSETDCRYIYIGEAHDTTFGGVVIRRCGTTSIQGAFTATR